LEMSNNGLKNKILLIFNPAAGKKKALKTEIFGVNGASEAKFKIKRTKSPGHATELAKKNRDKYLIVTAIGGDGTVNEVASGLVNTDIPLGIIPNGSGNGLARELGIPMNKKKAFDLLKKSTPIHIDTLLLNDHPCVNMAGIGFDARVAHFFDKMKARGFLNYIQATLKLMHTYKP
jgi:diacylglycerol kinase (ATP)